MPTSELPPERMTREGSQRAVSITELVRAEEYRIGQIRAAGGAVERVADDDEPVDEESARLLGKIPKRFLGATVRGYRAVTPSEIDARDRVTKWVRSVTDELPPMLALVGDPGVGKSHLLYAAARALIAQGHRPYVRAWYELADALRYGGKSAYTEDMLEPKDVRLQLHNAKIVLLDEIRPTAGTAFDDTELAKAACAWYDRAALVLITTNVNPLSDVLGPAAASRFLPLIVTGPDRRAPDGAT